MCTKFIILTCTPAILHDGGTVFGGIHVSVCLISECAAFGTTIYAYILLSEL